MNVSFPQTQAFLICQSGSRAGERFQVDKFKIQIGSGPDNDIVIQDRSILPHHASLFWQDGHLAIASLHPQASVLVNQRPVSQQGVYLNAGDSINLGQSGNVFQLVAANTIAGAYVPETPIRSSVPPRQKISYDASNAGTAPHALATTRYLCMAARVSQSFRHYVFKHNVGEKHRDVGESHGIDMLAVVKSCYIAQRDAFSRDVILCVLLVVQLISFITAVSAFTHIGNSNPSPFAPPTTLLLLLLTSVLIAVVSLLFSALFILLAYIKRIPVFIRVILLLIGILLFATVSNFVLSIFLYLGAWIVIVWNLWHMYYGTGTQQLMKNAFHPGNIEFPLDQQIISELTRRSDPRQNVIVYSGYSPFVGSGFDIGGWSVAIDSTKGKQELGATLTPEPFRVKELYDYVHNDIQNLKLPDLQISNKLYVNGKEISSRPEFFDNQSKRPRTTVDDSQVMRWMETFSENIRYYKCFRMISWQGELIVSIFVRFMQIEENLFIEVNFMVLPPLEKEYYFLDTIEPTFTLEKLLDLVRSSFFSVFPLWLLSPWRILTYLTRDSSAMRELRQVERQIAHNPAFDYGASVTLREFASSRDYRLHFQKLDEKMYVKTVQRQLLESIVSFLESKNIDTTDLIERQQAILNQGVIVSGGNFSGNYAIAGGQAKVVASNKKAS